MQYIVEYATYKFTFRKGMDALTFAELMAVHKDKYCPWVATIKVLAEEEDRSDD